MTKHVIATLSAKYQISIPKAVRDEQKWEAGQQFAFVPKEGAVLLVPVPSRDELRGIMRGADTSDIRDHTDRV